MKRTLCIITALVMCMTIAVTSVAADTFVPSVTAKPAPGLSHQTQIEVVDGDDKTVESFKYNDVKITPVAKKDDKKTAEEVKEALTEAYNTLNAENVKLEEVMPALKDVVAAAAEEYKDLKIADLVVKDLFNVALDEEIEEYLAKDGHFVKLRIKAKIAKDQFCAVMVCVDGVWEPVEFERNRDGSLTLKLQAPGVVAILVKP